MASPSVAQQKIADQLEQAGIRRYESTRPVRPPESLAALVAAAVRAADSRLRLELALTLLSRSRACPRA
jgi:hypothetical protein